MVGRLVFLNLKKVKTLLRYMFENKIKKKKNGLHVSFIVTPYKLNEQLSPPVINDALMDCLFLHFICNL